MLGYFTAFPAVYEENEHRTFVRLLVGEMELPLEGVNLGSLAQPWLAMALAEEPATSGTSIADMAPAQKICGSSVRHPAPFVRGRSCSTDSRLE